MGAYFFCIAPTAGATAHTPNSLRTQQPHSRREQDSRAQGRTLDDRMGGAGVRPGVGFPLFLGGAGSGAGAGLSVPLLVGRAAGPGPVPGRAGGGAGRGHSKTAKSPEARAKTHTPPLKKNPLPQRGVRREVGV
jgi:hypothetical protein